jgi:putative flavoprotein involved in K+ transport
MTTTASSEAADVIVVGAGQAGLAVAYHLSRQGARFEVLDAVGEIGESWRTRWDSLRLFAGSRAGK